MVGHRVRCRRLRRRGSGRSALVGVVVVVMLGVAGCASSRSPAAQEARAAGGAFPVSIKNQYGTTVVETKPTRVVSIGYREHDILLALGVKPVGLQQWMAEYEQGVGPWASQLLGDARPKVVPNTSAELNLGEIAKLKPDLIVGTYRGVTREEYEVLSRLAPTLVRPAGSVDYAVPYDVETRMIGRALGQERRAEELIAQVEQRFAAARKAHPEFQGKTAVIAYPLENGGLGVYNSQDPRGQFLRKLGFTIPEAIDQFVGDNFYRDLSPERLDLVGDVDLLLVVDFHLPATHYDDNELFQDLEVVRRGHAIYPMPYTNEVSHNTVLSVPYCIDKITPIIARTLAK